MTAPSGDSFPRQNARTLRYTLGRPRNVTVSPDGDTVLFLRSASGTERAGRLWRWTPSEGERELVDPAALLAGGSEELSAEERARRERAREAAGGIVGYSVDKKVTLGAFALSGRLFVTDVTNVHTRELDVRVAGDAVVDPRIDPTGRRVAFVCDRNLWVMDVADGEPVALTRDDDGDNDDSVSWGLADFVSAEELDRSRGFWWSPDGERLLVQRTDEASVPEWYVSSPADPALAPTVQRYPAAGTTNPDVSLWLVSLDGGRTRVELPAVDAAPEDAEYIATVSWTDRGAPVVSALSRDQQRMTWFAIDESGRTEVIRSVSDPSWVDVIPGSGTWDGRGRLLTVEVRDDTYVLCADGAPLTPPRLQVRAVVDVDDDTILVAASEDAGRQQIWTVSERECTPVTPADGWHAAARGGETLVVSSADLTRPLPKTTIHTAKTSVELESHAVTPLIEPRVHFVPSAPGRPRVVVLFPSGHEPGDAMLPVLLDPYGGPHHARVQHHQGAFRESQWLADQGFAVVVADGRGTPGSPSWERAVRGDFADPTLEDQVVGLHAAAHAFPDLDLELVAIRGWSFGGYLSALAVIDRPDVFHAAIAGAPVTDWRLYDTGYTERYLGIPRESDAEAQQAYERSSLLQRAATLSRPLQLIHGLADDNVFVAHTLQLSQVLTEHGRPHEVIPLSGITHMATQEEVAENLLLLQVDFLRRALNLSA
ncbi:MAG TPA: DPP IV N-terminal domain-containing protein [Actinomycetes bacterium]|nr:DPP IV N-terminal domain-containing protein [Actinomycetes bacterium]